MNDHPDHIITHGVQCCEACHSDLSDVQPLAEDKRQVFDIIVKMETTEHRHPYTSADKTRLYVRRLVAGGAEYHANFGHHLYRNVDSERGHTISGRLLTAKYRQ